MSISRFLIAAMMVVMQSDATPRAATSSGDWPQWRGPLRDGLCKETGLLTEWPEKGPPLVWKSTGRGEGYSAPTIAGGQIFGMGNRGVDELVWALNAATGKELWSAKVAAKSSRAGGGYEGPRCSPTVDNDRLYALGIQGDLVCLQTTDGKEVWKVS